MRIAVQTAMNACQGRMRIGWSTWRRNGEYGYALGVVQFALAYGSARLGAQYERALVRCVQRVVLLAGPGMLPEAGGLSTARRHPTARHRPIARRFGEQVATPDDDGCNGSRSGRVGAPDG